MTDEDAKNFDILKDLKCQNFIGTSSCYENLSLIKGKSRVFETVLKESDKKLIFKDLEGILSKTFINKIWEMIYTRYKIFNEML